MDAIHDDVRQSGFAFRFGWGIDGLRSIGPDCAVIVVVDVLRFTTAVCAALEAGVAGVLPYPWDDDHAPAFAAQHRAVLAGRREDGGPSLSPTDLLGSEPGTRIVLPSPNGSTLATVAAERGAEVLLAASLRNAPATARHAALIAAGEPIGVIAAGKRGVDSFRPAVEDLLGAGAVLWSLDPSGAVGPPCCSPEARAARAAFADARPALHARLAESGSGRELIRVGFADDVATAAAYDVTNVVARLDDGAFTAVVR